MGVVSALVEADGAHELAIEVALGAQAQDIVVETADEGKTAIRWLKHQGHGPRDIPAARPDRAARLRATACASGRRRPGVVGFATDLVRYEPRIEKAVRYLLGNVLVVESLDVAVDLERQRRAHALRDARRRHGQRAHGAMSGGSVKAAGLLHRTRESRELAAQLARAARREPELGGRVDALRAEIVRAARDAREPLAAGVQSQELEAARTRKDFEALESKLGDKSSQLAGLDARRGVMEAEIAQHRQAQERNSALLDEMAERLRAMEGDLSRVEAHVQREAARADEFSRELNDLDDHAWHDVPSELAT